MKRIKREMLKLELRGKGNTTILMRRSKYPCLHKWNQARQGLTLFCFELFFFCFFKKL